MTWLATQQNIPPGNTSSMITAHIIVGLGKANISGFGRGEISPNIYGLITMNNATTTIWSRVVGAITRNASGTKIANIIETGIGIAPIDVVRMIPLTVVPQGETIPKYLSPETPIWAAIMELATEAGRLLCGLFMAAKNFLKKLVEKIAEWGMKLLGTLLGVLGMAKNYSH